MALLSSKKVICCDCGNRLQPHTCCREVRGDTESEARRARSEEKEEEEEEEEDDVVGVEGVRKGQYGDFA